MEISDREYPLVPEQCLELGALIEDEENFPGGYDRELAEGEGDVGERFAKFANAGSNSLDGNPRVNQTLRGLEDDEVFETVSVVAAPSFHRRSDEVRLRPVLELAPGNAQELKHVPGAVER